MSLEIQQHITALHERLERLDSNSLDPHTQESLLELLNDLTRLLGSPPLDDADHPLTERLEQIAVRFEAQHPSVGTAVRQLIDALGQAGI